jgi:hypothetical protein
MGIIKNETIHAVIHCPTLAVAGATTLVTVDGPGLVTAIAALALVVAPAVSVAVAVIVWLPAATWVQL